ncbi:MAG: PEP-CTERM system histidine kinase PrsK [Methylococcaceae bacterium]|nr:PEP-CTERM system histidine kinase PrsK [Methylococcaceae bacterium]
MAFYCYLIGSLAYLLITVLLLISWRGNLKGRWLIAACITMMVWAGGIALQDRYGLLNAPLVWTLEVLHTYVWLVFLNRLLTRNGVGQDKGKSGYIFRRGEIFALMLVAYVWLSYYLESSFPFLFRPLYQLLGHLALVVIGLVLVEQYYRNAKVDQRWKIKFLCFALGGLFVFEFYLYSEAVLFLQVREDLWLARGIVAAMMAPLIVVSAARNPDWSMDIFISRQVVFHSTALLGSGTYLLLMATAGYYIKYYGGEWGAVLQIVFFVGAFLVLGMVLFSGLIRSKLRMFLAANFFKNAYDYREEWFRLIATLSVNNGFSMEQRVILALGQMVESPGGVLWTRENGRFIPRARHGDTGINIAEIDGNDPMIRFLQERETVVNFQEMLLIPEIYDGLNKPAWIEPYKQAWLLIPLWRNPGAIDGLVLLAKSPTFATWNREISEMLKTTSWLAASYLALEESAGALAEARQFEGFNRLSAFVIHDLKNLIAQLSLVVRNASKHQDNPEFMKDAIKTVEHAVDKMNSLMAQLRNSGSEAAAVTFDLREILTEVVEARKRQVPAPLCEAGATPLIVRANRQRLASALEHVIHNGQDAAEKQGKVLIRLRAELEKGLASVEIEDNGCGMSEEFIRTRLFKPFDTTKGLTGMGIGAYESREYARSLGGDLLVKSEPGKGSRFYFKIPLAKGVSQAYFSSH